MDTVYNTPLIGNTDYVIIGGSISSLSAAIYLAEHNYKVIMAVKGTFLISDLCSPNFYYLENISNKSGRYFNIIFSKGIDANDVSYRDCRVLHPDRVKLNAEDICRNYGIEYIYAAIPVDISSGENDMKILRIGGKFGIAAILCRDVLNLDSNKAPDRYIINVMEAPDIKDKEIINVVNHDKSFNVIVRPGPYGKGHVTFDIPISNKKEDADDGKWEYNLKGSVFDLFKWIKENAIGYSGISLGRSGIEGFSSLYDVEKEIGKGISSAKNIINGIRQGVDGKKSVLLPKNMRMLSHNGIIDYRGYGVYKCASPWVNRIVNADVVVAGGGTSGVMAAVYAARQGMKTVLVEFNKQCGGTATAGGVSTYWFGKRFADTLEVDLCVESIYKELGLDRGTGIWSSHDDFNPDIKSTAIIKMCIDAGVEVIFDTLCFAAIIEEDNGTKLKGIAAVNSRGILAVLGKYIIDATGDGDIAAFAGADYTYGTGRDVFTYWASLAQYTSPDKYKNNFSSTVVVSDPIDYTRFISLGRRRGQTFDHGTYVAPRESRHIRGLYEVTLKDVVTFKNYDDTLYTCFSNYDPKGKLTADMVYAGILPPQMSIAVPIRALLAVDGNGSYIKGLMVAGKSISCTHNAFPGMRMQPDLQHQGAVIGIAAACAVCDSVDFLDLDMERLQQKIRAITKDELKVAGQKNMTEVDIVTEIKGRERLEWVDLPFTEEIESLPLSMRAAAAESQRILPELEHQFLCEKNKSRKSTLARFILWHGSDTATSFIMGEIMDELLSIRELPLRNGSTMCAQLLPDHGVMAEIICKLNLLAWSKRNEVYKPFEVVLDRLLHTDRDYLDIRKSTYHYIEAFAYTAERTCIKEFIPMLKVLAGLPELRQAVSSRGSKIDILEERLVMLQLSIYRALARCGDIEGYDGLINLLDNSCASVAISACMELQRLTGNKTGIDAGKWHRKIHSGEFSPAVCPISLKSW